MDFDTFLGQAWADHADAAQAVAERLDEAPTLVHDEAQLVRLADLAHHVRGAHLAQWRAAAEFIEGLKGLRVYASHGPSGQALRRLLASLALCAHADADADLSALEPSDLIRVLALAADNLVEHEPARALRLFRDAVERAERSGLAPSDPMNRQLAVAGNNLASTLEEKPGRSAEERELMLFAAQAARRYWALAGTWLETERAEYRLAMSWLQAGDPAQARTHAQACLEIVAANGGAALERLFAWEALGRVERAAGNLAGHAQALAQARDAYAALDDDDKTWCAASLEQLAA
jgi:hypothetical protein